MPHYYNPFLVLADLIYYYFFHFRCWQISFCRNSQVEQQQVVDAVREEIEMMSHLKHPNVVRILGATQQACHFFMFVEWMPGLYVLQISV